MKKILITGANFNNKGAQSMLFITVNEIRNHFSDAEIFFTTWENLPEFNNLTFQPVFYNEEAMRIALNSKKTYCILFTRLLKNVVKKAMKKEIVEIKRFYELKELIQDITLIVDISGYNLGSKWGVAGSENFLNYIRLAKLYEIPMVVMPQSFGPFDYNEKDKGILEEIKELLPYPLKIYAREWEGYRLLTDKFLLKNVEKSADIVLQNTGIDLSNIYKTIPQIKSLNINTIHNVAVIPNQQCVIHGNYSVLINTYKKIIQLLLKSEKDVYVFRHAGEDLKLCIDIKNLFESNVNVHLIDYDFSCLEFDQFIKNFEFSVCSRFHAIVHAYRNGIPCIVLGWALKYKELTEAVAQGQFCFDILNSTDESGIMNAVREMCSAPELQSKIISEYLYSIRKENCFDIFTLKETMRPSGCINEEIEAKISE